MGRQAALTRSPEDGEVAYELLVTLLKHQLSSPVQWIKTQNSLYESRQPGQRYVEIGPSDTLHAMLKKTLAQYPEHDRRDVEVLTFGDELEAVKKAGEDDFEDAPATAINENVLVDSAQTLLHRPEPQPPIAMPLSSQPPKLAVLADAPPTASEAMLSIVASGLRVPKSSINTAQSLRFMAKGRSALQNEIVGNLHVEFEQLPDDVENIAISDLADMLQPLFNGKLGKYLNEWLAKKVSAKLAPSLTVSKIRAHLNKVYGLQTGRQNSFFLTADFNDISVRQRDEQESWRSIDKWANTYVQERGLIRSNETEALPDGAPGSVAQEVMVDKSILTNFSRDLSSLMEKHFGSNDIITAPQSQPEEAAEQHTAHLAEELGSDFINGTRPIFKPELVYQYQSGWNWAVQDLFVTLSTLITRLEKRNQDDHFILERWTDEACERLQARSTDRMIQCAKFLLEKWQRSPQSTIKDHCVQFLGRLLRADESTASIEPHPESNATPTRRTVPRTTVTEDGEITYQEVPVAEADITSQGSEASREYLKVEASDMDFPAGITGSTTGLPAVTLLTRGPGSVSWETDVELTAELHQAEKRLATDGDAGLYGTILVIGAGQRSIGFVLVRRLLEAGCRVALCTNRPTAAARKEIAQLFVEAARPEAELVLLPFNQGSVQDMNSIVSHINDTLGWEIDHLVPFAAIPERGRTLQDLDSTSELAHRVMLTNTLRLMGIIATSKQRRQVLNHSTQVLVPLSPNHGQFSNDGLYAESKLALEALLNKWGSESWSDQLSICAVRIGWTRGTGLMATNDILAEDVEKMGIRTFSAVEMATLLTLVMTPGLAEASTLQPILCDFSGGLMTNGEFGSEAIEALRTSLQTASSVRKRLKEEAKLDAPPQRKCEVEITAEQETRATLGQPFPNLPEHREDAANGHLQGVLDLDSVVVVTGFAEHGPAGSSRTRWELEAQGEFSLEGCVELAWMTGLIRYERNRVHDGKDAGPGWVECESEAPIREMDVKAQLEERIREHTGIRILDPGDGANTNPRLRNMLHEVGMQEDLPPFECSPEAAEALRARHGDGVEILSSDGVTATARIRRGASIFVPKAMNTDFFVAAQMPTGWDGARYGIPPDVLTQADKPALYTLVCAVEAFLSAGLTDVYELYRYIHVSEVGNCIGSGAGGIPAIQLFHEQRLLGKEVRNDILSEAFIGTVAAWVNLLLLSASGPIKTGAGTCATSLESLDTACELIQSGRTKVCLAGGYDVFTHPVYYEFGAMTALANASGDERSGREPREMSRPFTSTRGGFVLGEGVGIQVVSSAALALELGLPIYGVVAMTHLAGDKLGRSVPAPGRGMLTAARQTSEPKVAMPAMLLNPGLRAKRIQKSLAMIEEQATEDEAVTRAEAEAAGCSSDEIEWRAQSVREAARLKKKAIQRALGQQYYVGHARISPIAGALSVYGLTVDDITFASLHGTATKLNDINECATLDQQMRHLGRHPGNPLLTIAQKSVVGHGLGASGAWAVNGALQAMHSGVVPGNRNADDVDKALETFDHLLLTNKNITVRPEDMKAFSVTSFGFGQKGAQVLIVHPRYLYAAISDDDYEAYRVKQMARAPKVARELDRGLHGRPLFKAKTEMPYKADQQQVFLLDPLARMTS